MFKMDRRTAMPQISLYVDKTTLKKIEHAAAREHTSLSKWVVTQIKTKIDPVYPADYEKLFGAVQDTSFKRPEELSYSEDTARESL